MIRGRRPSVQQIRRPSVRLTKFLSMAISLEYTGYRADTGLVTAMYFFPPSPRYLSQGSHKAGRFDAGTKQVAQQPLRAPLLWSHPGPLRWLRRLNLFELLQSLRIAGGVLRHLFSTSRDLNIPRLVRWCNYFPPTIAKSFRCRCGPAFGLATLLRYTIFGNTCFNCFWPYRLLFYLLDPGLTPAGWPSPSPARR